MTDQKQESKMNTTSRRHENEEDSRPRGMAARGDGATDATPFLRVPTRSAPIHDDAAVPSGLGWFGCVSAASTDQGRTAIPRFLLDAKAIARAYGRGLALLVIVGVGAACDPRIEAGRTTNVHMPAIRAAEERQAAALERIAASLERGCSAEVGR